MDQHSWVVLSNEQGLILAVYGSALETIATHKGVEIREQANCCVAIHRIVGSRPCVYQTISMRGQHTWL